MKGKHTIMEMGGQRGQKAKGPTLNANNAKFINNSSNSGQNSQINAANSQQKELPDIQARTLVL